MTRELDRYAEAVPVVEIANVSESVRVYWQKNQFTIKPTSLGVPGSTEHVGI